MAGAVLQTARLHPAHGLARQLVGPGAVQAGRLVGSVEVDHQPAPRGLAEQRLVQVHHFLCLVVEEVELHADRAGAGAAVEELAPRLGRAQVLAVLPQPDADAVAARVLDHVAELLVAPALPEALDDVVFEPELAGPAVERFHLRRRVWAAVEVFPHGPAGLDPVRREALREQLRVRRRAEAADDVAVDQAV